MNDDRSLERAEEFLSQLEGDRESAPLEVLPLIEAYQPRLEDSIRRFREGRISARELEAHAFQIRLTYARDLKRLLLEAPPPPDRWVRAG